MGKIKHMQITTVTIRKPLYGNFCYIRGSIIEKAIRLGNKLRIILPHGSVVMDPNDWKKDCKMMKKVFKFVDNPMILYGNYAPIKSKKGKVFPTIEAAEKEPARKQLNLF
jgi:hypothetical protein